MAEYVPESGCLLWTSSTRGKGYGSIKHGVGNSVYAHRAMYELTKGKIGEGMLVCHTCDTPSCINPNHLFLGSNNRNMKDMVEKGRQMHGERHVCAVLSEQQARSVFDSTLNSKALSKKFGVSISAIRHIRAGRTWRHLRNAA